MPGITLMYLLGRHRSAHHPEVLGQLDRDRRQIAGYRSVTETA